MPVVTPPATHGLSPGALPQRIALIIDGLCQAAAARLGRKRETGLLLILLWSRLRPVAARLAAIVARAATLRLAVPRQRSMKPPSRPPVARTLPARTPPPPSSPRLPQRIAWLVRLVPEAAPYASQLQHLLSEPEIAALLAASAPARRLLRPLCRMLAVRLTAAETAASPASPPVIAGTNPRPAVTPSRKPPRSATIPFQHHLEFSAR